MSETMKTIRYCGDERFGEAVLLRLKKAGFAITESAEADVTLTYFLSLSSLEDAYFEKDGLIQDANQGSYLVDLSPSTPSFARELYAVASVSEIKLVEAPLVVKDIVRPDSLEDSSNLMCYTAGEQKDIDSVSDVLTALVGSTVFFGEAGSAQLARCTTTLTGLAVVSSAIEALALCKAAYPDGAPAEFLKKALEARSPFDQRTQCLLTMLENKNYSGQFSVHMWAAEIAASLMAADDFELILPSTEATLQLLELLIVIGGADLNPNALSLIYGEEAACAEQGLDWTRAEQVYDSFREGQDLEEDFDAGYLSGFDQYSSN